MGEPYISHAHPLWCDEHREEGLAELAAHRRAEQVSEWRALRRALRGRRAI